MSTNIATPSPMTLSGHRQFGAPKTPEPALYASGECGDIHRDVEIALEAARRLAAEGTEEAEEMRKIAPGLFPKASRPVAIAVSATAPGTPRKGSYLHKAPCPVCGQSVFGLSDKVYCGQRCNQSAYDKRRRDICVPKRYRKPRPLAADYVHPEPCVCGEPVTGRKGKRYCSPTCKSKVDEQRRQEKYQATRKSCKGCHSLLALRSKREYCAECSLFVKDLLLLPSTRPKEAAMCPLR